MKATGKLSHGLIKTINNNNKYYCKKKKCSFKVHIHTKN